MIHGYELIQPLCAGLLAFMETHGFESIEDFRGHALSYFTTHAELVRRQGAIRTAERAAKSEMVTRDAHWDAEKFVEQSSRLVSND